jgi:hypothetical protein
MGKNNKTFGQTPAQCEHVRGVGIGALTAPNPTRAYFPSLVGTFSPKAARNALRRFGRYLGGCAWQRLASASVKGPLMGFLWAVMNALTRIFGGVTP